MKIAGGKRPVKTEAVNAATARLDRMSALELARVINRQDRNVAAAVERALPQIAAAIDLIADALRRGGRLIYVGCGTSGRIAALDAAEIQPTFGTPIETVQYVVAGGDRALGLAAEYNEDSPQLGVRDMLRRRPGRRDVAVGVAASGSTPYTLGALKLAKKKGAKVIVVTCNQGSPMEKLADIAIVVEAGPEVVAGSTRMKAGTAQKLVINMLSTGAMARLGRVYGNLMVYVDLKNAKLVQRGLEILRRATGCDATTARSALRQTKGSVAVAVVMLKAGISAADAAQRLQRAGGHVRRAVEGTRAEKSRVAGTRRR